MLNVVKSLTAGKNIITLFLLTIVSFNAKAVTTGEIVGRVTDKETNRAVAYAEIVFENKMDKVTVTANENGFYYASHLPTGKYQMRVQYNHRSFFINKVQVYDGYTSEINLALSSSNTLPEKVELPAEQNITSCVSNNNPKLSHSDFNQPSRSLADVLSNQPGVDVRDGKIYVKGSDQVRFFIDGTPVMGQPSQTRGW